MARRATMIVARLSVTRTAAAAVITGLGAGGRAAAVVAWLGVPGGPAAVIPRLRVPSGRRRGRGHRPVAPVVVGEPGRLGLAEHRDRDLVAERRIPGQPGDGGCGCD